MFYVRALVTVLAATAFALLPSVGMASAAPAGSSTLPVSVGDALSPDDTPWN